MAETPATLCNTGAGGHSTPRSHHGVDVAFAEKEFKELERKLSQRPAATQGSGSDSDNNEKQDWSANVRTAAASAEGEDLEKGDERFDLREYLTASNDENQSAGIKHKVSSSTPRRSPRFMLNLRFAACWRHLGGFAG